MFVDRFASGSVNNRTPWLAGQAILIVTGSGARGVEGTADEPVVSMAGFAAVLAKLGPRVDRLSLKWVHSGEHRSPAFAAWAERLWRRPLTYGAIEIGRAHV